MNLAGWKERIYENLWQLRVRMEEYKANTVSGLLSGMALWPVLEAAQKGDVHALIAFGKLTSDLGTGLLGDKFAVWTASVNSEPELVATLEADDTLREELDGLLEKLDVLVVALQREKEDRAWLQEELKKEWAGRGKGQVIKTLIKQQVKINYGEVVGTKVEHHHHYAQESKQEELENVRRHYLARLRQSYLELPLAPLGLVKRPDKKVTLSQVYIELNTTFRVKKDGSPVDKEEGITHKDTRRLTILEAAQRHPHLVILGDPGSGKSTFLKYFLAELCEKAEAKNDQPLPVLIVLRALAARLRNLALPADWQNLQQVLVEAVMQEVLLTPGRLQAEAFKDTLAAEIRAGNAVIAFDGLDEVPLEERGLLKEAILAFIAEVDPQKTMITCRVRSYNGESVIEGFPSYTLSELNPDQMESFCRAWYNALADSGAYDPGQAKTRGDDIASALKNPTIGVIGNNPMLLTTLAIVHEQDNQLPHQRVVLYDRAIEILLTRWEGARDRLETAAGERLSDFLKEKTRVWPVLQQLAFIAHNSGREGGKNRAADIEWEEAVRCLNEALGDLELARAFLQYVDERAGLLVGEGDASGLPARYSFAHRTFQEYLAGCYLLKYRDPELVGQLKSLAELGEYWNLAVQLCSEEIYYNRRDENKLLDIASMLCDDEANSIPTARLSTWAGHFAVLAGSPAVLANKGVHPRGGEEFLDRMKTRLVSCLESRLPPVERAEAGRQLAYLGDPRSEVMTIEGMRFCYVPAGPFLMGDEGIRVEVPYDYWIAQFPVTNAQFEVFIQEGGYTQDDYWTAEGNRHKQTQGWEKPRIIEEPFGLPNHPVVGVSWYEADAFAQWMEKRINKKGWQVKLANDPEWEKAARGGVQVPQKAVVLKLAEISGVMKQVMEKNPAPVRRFAWIDDETEADKMNYGGTEVGATAAAGCYTRGASVYGVQELSGQVWEWLRSFYRSDYNKLKVNEWAKEEARDKSGSRVWRGGAFVNEEYYCRCAYRNYNLPYLRDDDVGFRIVLRPPA